VIENSVSNAVLADLDGAGWEEILYAAYDGKVHAFWLDKTEHGNWPYDVPGTGRRFAAEPVVVDLNGDGAAEVIFTSWGEKAGATTAWSSGRSSRNRRHLGWTPSRIDWGPARLHASTRAARIARRGHRFGLPGQSPRG
jgi:hypothetical protein